jgi:hypothetical protein
VKFGSSRRLRARNSTNLVEGVRQNRGVGKAILRSVVGTEQGLGRKLYGLSFHVQVFYGQDMLHIGSLNGVHVGYFKTKDDGEACFS